MALNGPSNWGIVPSVDRPLKRGVKTWSKIGPFWGTDLLGRCSGPYNDDLLDGDLHGPHPVGHVCPMWDKLMSYPELQAP